MNGESAMQLLADDDALIDDCWNRIGVHGDKQCPLLERHVHCRNCEVYAAAATRLLDRYALMQDHQAAVAQPVEENTGRSMLLFRLGEEWLALATAWPALTMLANAPSFLMMLSVLLWLSFLYGLYNGAMIPALTEIMPAEVRVAGFSLAYSLATAVFGGFTPVMSTALIEYTGDKASPGYWMSFAAVCALLATLYLYRRRAASLQNTVKSQGAA